MPICTNPACGEISKSKTRFCPHCGQESLSNLRKDEIGGFEEIPLTTETFEREIFGISATKDLTSKKKNPRISVLKKMRKRNRSLKDLASLILFILFMVATIFAASPGALKDSIFQKIGLQDKFSLDFQENRLQFKFLEYAENGVPAYFKGCGPIDYYVRQNYASGDDLTIVSTALSIIGSGIGRPFEFKGTTQERNVNKLPNSVLIDFTSEYESKDIQKAVLENGDVAGLGGPAVYETTTKPRFDSQAATRGNIWINQEYWQSMSRDEKLIVVMHEMGHVLGLTHPMNGLNQIMDVGGYYGTSLGSGALMGLRILSALAGCRAFPDYLLDSSKQSSATNEITDNVNSNDSNIGEITDSGNVSVNRLAISTGLNSCGNNFPESVQSLNLDISTNWIMQENDGCGSGRSYTWSNPKNPLEYVYLQFSASVGWCQDLDPEDLEGIKSRFGLKFKSFEKSAVDDGRHFYVYTRTSSDMSQEIYGIIEIGNADQWCGDGDTLLELSEGVRGDDELTSRMVASVFG